MPQMAPISWLLLFIVFSITFILFNIMNYYSFIPVKPNLEKKTLKSNHYYNWKW